MHVMSMKLTRNESKAPASKTDFLQSSILLNPFTLIPPYGYHGAFIEYEETGSEYV
jgi:hypothetical protein